MIRWPHIEPLARPMWGLSWILATIGEDNYQPCLPAMARPPCMAESEKTMSYGESFLFIATTVCASPRNDESQAELWYRPYSTNLKSRGWKSIG